MGRHLWTLSYLGEKGSSNHVSRKGCSLWPSSNCGLEYLPREWHILGSHLPWIAQEAQFYQVVPLFCDLVLPDLGVSNGWRCGFVIYRNELPQRTHAERDPEGKRWGPKNALEPGCRLSLSFWIAISIWFDQRSGLWPWPWEQILINAMRRIRFTHLCYRSCRTNNYPSYILHCQEIIRWFRITWRRWSRRRRGRRRCKGKGHAFWQRIIHLH